MAHICRAAHSGTWNNSAQLDRGVVEERKREPIPQRTNGTMEERGDGATANSGTTQNVAQHNIGAQWNSGVEWNNSGTMWHNCAAE